MIKVLKNWQEIGEATLSLQWKGLPTHSDVRKNWDNLLVYNLIKDRDINSTIIDLGCSPYCTLNLLNALGFNNLHGIDFEISDNIIDQVPYHLYRGDITKTPFISDFCDIAISVSVVEHGVDLKAFFQEVSRVLKLDGLLFLTTDYWEEKIRIDEAIKPLGLPWKIFDKSDIQDLISTAQEYGIFIEEDLTIPSCSEKPISFQGIDYTFISLVFRKKQSLQTVSTFNENISKRENTIDSENSTIETEIISTIGKTTNLVESVISSIERYHKNPFDQSVLADVRYTQKQIAEFWLSLEESELADRYLGDVGNAHRVFLNSGVKNEPLTDTEQRFLDEIVAKVSGGLDEPKALNYLLASILYSRAYQLPLQYEIPRIPQWFLNDYLGFMCDSPSLFQEVGEPDRYYQYVSKWLDYLHKNIFSHQDSKLWQDVALFFTKHNNFIPLYFNTVNLKNICKKRADILEFALKIQGNQLEYDFPMRSPERKKIRVGILAAHFQPQTETFATLPLYKHLNRELFEIILYTLQVSNHRLERYSSGHADAMVLLPQDLSSQVQTIRNEDLDIIIISTNVTAWTNPTALLALHRLARVQIANVCSCITTGMRHIDYYISGKLTEPENNAQDHYTERLITLDGSAHCYDFATEEQLLATISVTRESLGIDQNAIVYISGSNFYKITPEVGEAWAKIIAGTPNSILVLYPFNPNWSSSYAFAAFQKRLVASFEQNGVSQDRLIILDSVPNVADVRERLKLGDIYLDSYPFAGATSLLDPLEVGLPSVVMGANTFRSLVGVALLKELQIYELITENEESYIELAISLGNNPELRQQMRDRIKEKMQGNPGFLDSRSYSAKIGILLGELFQTQQGNALNQDLKLREINLIIFPDWSKSEELLLQELSTVVGTIGTHQDRSQMTLLIDTSNIPDEEADVALSSVVMNLLLEDELDLTEGPEVSLIGTISQVQWEILLSRTSTRIILENENKEGIAKVGAETLPSWDIDSLGEHKFIL